MIRSDTTAIVMIPARGRETAIPKMLSAENISVPFFMLFHAGWNKKGLMLISRSG
jgi:hypothetical protein